MDLDMELSSDEGGSEPVCRGMSAESEPSLDVESDEVRNVFTELASLCLAEIEMTDDLVDGIDNDEAEESDDIRGGEFRLSNAFDLGAFDLGFCLCMFPRPPRPV